MKVSDPGHVYELSNGETLTFIKRTNGELVHDGIQNEELIDVLLDRMHYLQGVLACRENALVVTKLEEAQMWLERRTTRRVRDNVETTDQPHVER